jgi:two-component system, LytTR family, sensor kinase
VLFAIATAFGLSSTLQAWALESLAHEPLPPRVIAQLLTLNLAYWYVPALVAPFIMRAVMRDRVSQARWSVQIGVHTAGALAYSIVHTAAMLALRAILLPAGGRADMQIAWWPYALRHFLMQLDWALMTYLFLVGLAHALAYRRESEAMALDTARLETRLVEAQLQALQRQLHPHFLFNTLNTISGLMRFNVDAADRMIDRLGALLRLTLHTSARQEVPLIEELQVLETYLDIEQTRFGDRLTVKMNIDPETRAALVPNLLFQPLVENAIRYGVAPHANPGSVSITTTRLNQQLVIQVRDSGDGASSARASALRQGVGLTNTRARLTHLYGEAHQFDVSKGPDGFTVAVTIPFHVENLRIEPGAHTEAVPA